MKYLIKNNDSIIRRIFQLKYEENWDREEVQEILDYCSDILSGNDYIPSCDYEDLKDEYEFTVEDMRQEINELINEIHELKKGKKK